ncbi:crotonyl-CoA carboxylase/reductase [Sinosporangium album]|uniref:Crotonyl-CoA carboxylase/reductase n=1 Tax=Sinosporangium album TaxID=504805 RepID=A0A1G8GP28_9ACTN|nr:crotonyl-CoA carboxylase/reductase [Sinosporangium album]SDH96103.1 crotonyl-CoA carboxylase/reductase [Sinosporangium album]
MTLFEVGEPIPLGVVPDRMYAAVIRPDRYGEPSAAFQTEIIDVPPLGRRQVLVRVMAAGVNYNNVWASLGTPVDVVAARRRRGAQEDFHIGGSDASGVVWAVGEDVRSVAVGDHVILSGIRFDEHGEDVRLGADPASSLSASAWGYEDNFGSFAQFTAIDDYQCHPKPANLTWEEASSFLLTAATAYRQLCGWHPHVVRPGDPVLIWGGAGGLGSMAIQITNVFGGIPIAVVSGEERADFCLKLGARGVIDRRDFDHWGRLPDIGDGSGLGTWMSGVRAFGRRFWDVLGERRAPKIVLEHPGQDTIPTSLYLCDSGGMVVICGGTSGYNADVDLRFLWMRQKRLQGSHYATLSHIRAVIDLVATGRIDHCLSWTGRFDQIGHAHQMLHDNVHPLGNMSVLIGAPTAGLTTLPENALPEDGRHG